MPRWIPALLLCSGCEALTERVPPISGWEFSAHPCVGNRTDALLAESDDQLWVGCGSTTVGYGLFTSTDGGLSWAPATTKPASALEGFRVSSIQRADDGLLYVGGIDTNSSKRVVALEADGTVIDVFSSTNQVWSSFHVGTFRRTPSGLAVAESLTGAGVAVRTDDDAAWEDGTGWWTAGESVQILDMVLDGDDLYACGSTISQPPQVFLPAGGPGFRMDPVVLGDGRTGELWGLDVHEGAVVAAGVDQGADVGLVFTSGPDPARAADFAMLDVSELVGDESTWMRGACRRGDEVWAVGEYSRTGDGLILRSTDGGASWEDVTPTDEAALPAMHRCQVTDEGPTVLAGAEGVVAVAF